jgi:hypothetical protein
MASRGRSDDCPPIALFFTNGERVTVMILGVLDSRDRGSYLHSHDCSLACPKTSLPGKR